MSREGAGMDLHPDGHLGVMAAEAGLGLPGSSWLVGFCPARRRVVLPGLSPVSSSQEVYLAGCGLDQTERDMGDGIDNRFLLCTQ
jgi:hypothetical protein